MSLLCLPRFHGAESGRSSWSDRKRPLTGKNVAILLIVCLDATNRSSPRARTARMGIWNQTHAADKLTSGMNDPSTSGPNWIVEGSPRDFNPEFMNFESTASPIWAISGEFLRESAQPTFARSTDLPQEQACASLWAGWVC